MDVQYIETKSGQELLFISVPVGNMPPHKAELYLDTVRASIRKKLKPSVELFLMAERDN